MELTQETIATSPYLARWPGFLSPDTVARVLELVADEAWLCAQEVDTERGREGASCELAATSDAVLREVRDQVLEGLGLEGAQLTTLRFRRYREGNFHTAHFDDYELDGLRLCVTVLLGLETPEEGGETHFTRIGLKTRIAVGDALCWVGVRPSGVVDPASLHEGLAVVSGTKATLGCFVYADPAKLSGARFLQGVRLPDPAPARSLYCLDTGVPAETSRSLRHACEDRGVAYLSVNPRGFDFLAGGRLPVGSMLFAPSTSVASQRVEQFLFHEGVATLYADGHGPDQFVDNQLLFLERAGVPVPRTVYGLDDDPALLASYVDKLGGFPVVLKVQGFSLGVGIMQVDGMEALLSTVEFLRATGRPAFLQAAVLPSVHWRLVVVGTDVVASYRNPVRAGDFRSTASDDPADYSATPPASAVAVALRACAVLGYEHGGVDVLVHASGRVYVLEVNFPCYFGHAQIEGGVDVAGAIVEHLVAKAERVEGGSGGEPPD